MQDTFKKDPTKGNLLPWINCERVRMVGKWTQDEIGSSLTNGCDGKESVQWRF